MWEIPKKYGGFNGKFIGYFPLPDYWELVGRMVGKCDLYSARTAPKQRSFDERMGAAEKPNKYINK